MKTPLVMLLTCTLLLPALAANDEREEDRASTIERIGPNKIGQSEVDWVIGPVGQLAGRQT